MFTNIEVYYGGVFITEDHFRYCRSHTRGGIVYMVLFVAQTKQIGKEKVIKAHIGKIKIIISRDLVETLICRDVGCGCVIIYLLGADASNCTPSSETQEKGL